MFVHFWWRRLHSVHEGALHLIEDHDAETEEHDHKGKGIAEHPPFVATHAEHTILEELDDSREGIQLHDEHQFRIGDGRERVDDRRGIHPQADEEGEQQLQVAVLGRHTGEEDTESECQAGEHHYQHGNQQRIPIGVNLHIGEDLVVGIDGEEERKLDAKTHEIADGIAQGGDESGKIDFAEDAGVGNEGVAGLV